MSIDLLTRVIEGVPEYSCFKTFKELEESTDEIAREYRDVVRVIEIGRSRCGERIRALVIGSGSRRALLFGAPHPNEPVGTLVLDYLSRRLASDEELRRFYDYTWVIVKVADIDGLKMNEGWFKNPRSIEAYARNYYRPAGNVQIEWSFPIEYKRYSFSKPVPETMALMNIIDSYKPDFIYSLHNAGFGGVYYYISEEAPLIYPILYFYPKTLGVPLSLGEPEVPWARQLSRAVYKMVSTREYYDFIESQGLDPVEVIRHGGSSYDYASRVNPGVIELVTEVPYYYDPRIEDLRESDEKITRRKSVLDRISWSENVYEFIKSVWSRARNRIGSRDPCSESGKLIESIEYYVETMPKSLEAQKRWAATDSALDRIATVAEVFDNTYVSRFYSLLTLGMLLRLLNREYERYRSVSRDIVEETESRFRDILDYLESNKMYRAIEISRLVKIQLAAGLYTALYKQVKS